MNFPKPAPVGQSQKKIKLSNLVMPQDKQQEIGGTPRGSAAADEREANERTPDERKADEQKLPGNGVQEQSAKDQADPTNTTDTIYYSKVEFVDEDPPRLDFRRPAGAATPPPGMRALRHQIEDTARLVRILFQDDAVRRRKVFLLLHATAFSGLCGPGANIEVGLDNLQDVKNSIEDFYPAVRGKLWNWNLGLLGAVGIACVIATVATWWSTNMWPWDVTKVNLGQAWFMAAFLIPLGTIIGLFAEFVFRVNDDITYEQLRTINPGRWKPVQRALNTTIVAFIFAGILSAGLIQVGVSNVLLNDFVKDKPLISLAIGFVTGFAFPYVRDLVQQVRPTLRDGANRP